MAKDLLSIGIHYRWQTLMSWLVLVGGLIILLFRAHLYIWFKLSLLVLVAVVSAAIIYHFVFQTVVKLDLLLNINNAVVWLDNATELYAIKRMFGIGYGLTIIRLINARNCSKRLTVLIFGNTVNNEDYKNLRRIIKWKQLEAN